MLFRPISIFVIPILVPFSSFAAYSFDSKRGDCQGILEKSLAYWDPRLEELLTYKLTREQIETLSRVSSPDVYETWLRNFRQRGWSETLLRHPEFSHLAFRAYREAALTLHEFFTGMMFSYGVFETQVPVEVVEIHHENIDGIIEQYIVPLHPKHRLPFRQRVLNLPVSERVLLEFTEEWKVDGFLFGFSWFGGLGVKPAPPDEHGNYPRIPPPGTHSHLTRRGESKFMRGSILSSSVRQILTDVMHGENGIQHTPVIGNENSLDLSHALKLGGRSVSLPFQEIETHWPHGESPNERPLTVVLHDYYHNELASRTARKIRTELVPYILDLVFKHKGFVFERLPLPFAKKSFAGGEFETRFVHHRLTFMGIQKSVEPLTDLDSVGWSVLRYLDELANPLNLRLHPFDNKEFGIDNLAVFVILCRDIVKNRPFWSQYGFGEKEEQELLDKNYRARYIRDQILANEI